MTQKDSGPGGTTSHPVPCRGKAGLSHIRPCNTMICAPRRAINGFNVFLQLYGEAQASLPIPSSPHCKVYRKGLGWLVDRKNTGTQMGGCSSGLDTILIDGGMEIQNGRVTHLVGGFTYH
jgi:hypothetical protein